MSNASIDSITRYDQQIAGLQEAINELNVAMDARIERDGARIAALESVIRDCLNLMNRQRIASQDANETEDAELVESFSRRLAGIFDRMKKLVGVQS